MTARETLRRNLPAAGEHRELRLEIEEFNAEYAYVLDEGDLEMWPGFFTDDAVYRVTGRENADYDLPIGLIFCDGKGMFLDRVRAILKTTMHAPRYLRHFSSNVRVLDVDSGGAIRATTNYLVVETLMEDETRIFQAGRYDDVFVRDDGGLLLRERQCIYDSLIIPNAQVYPV